MFVLYTTTQHHWTMKMWLVSFPFRHSVWFPHYYFLIKVGQLPVSNRGLINKKKAGAKNACPTSDIKCISSWTVFQKVIQDYSSFWIIMNHFDIYIFYSVIWYWQKMGWGLDGKIVLPALKFIIHFVICFKTLKN